MFHSLLSLALCDPGPDAFGSKSVYEAAVQRASLDSNGGEDEDDGRSGDLEHPPPEAEERVTQQHGETEEAAREADDSQGSSTNIERQ